MTGPRDHPALDALLAYWLDDSDDGDAATDAIDEHLMQCAACGERLDELIALGEGVRAAFRAGAVSAVASGAFVGRLAGQGLRIREYRLSHNGSVNCTVAPGDEVLVSRLQAPLQGVERLDLRVQRSITPDEPRTLHDVPFDAAGGEVVVLQKLAEIRQLPAHDSQVTLLAVSADGTREVGRYTFHHSPWAGG